MGIFVRIEQYSEFFPFDSTLHLLLSHSFVMCYATIAHEDSLPARHARLLARSGFCRARSGGALGVLHLGNLYLLHLEK